MIVSKNISQLNTLGLECNPKDCMVVVGMSGGVDSSVAAALLKSEGYNVVGVTLQLYPSSNSEPSKGTCCAGIDIYDARNVADELKIPHYVLDYESKFKESVIEDFVDEYLSGRTPIPCVKCNQTVKFTDLLSFSKDLNAQALATGHYVQRKIGKDGVELHTGSDLKKDQSYFLFATTKKQLEYLRFPLGGLSKQETRLLAKKFNLPVKDKPESQDICFVPDGSYSNIVKKLKPESILDGEIVHVDGSVLGNHKGIINFTVGQRKGIGIGGRQKSKEERLYVIEVNPDTKRVYVGPKEALKVSSIFVDNLNFLDNNELGNKQKEIYVKLRSTGELIKSELIVSNSNTEIIFKKPVYGVSPGQAAVLYDFRTPSKVLGGGWITRSEKLFNL